MKNILITGATSGIGLHVAKYLEESGYSLILTGRNREILRKLNKELENCIGIYDMDLTDIGLIPEIFEDMKRKGIKLDGLVHSAGLEGGLLPIRLVKMDTLELLMKLHYLSFVEIGKQFYKKSISNEGSCIIGMSSLASVMCQKNSVDYSSSKAALNASVKVMSKEFLKRNIRVNAILPANVDSPMTKDLKEIVDIRTIQPMGLIEPRQIAYLVEFLISDKSSFITGALIPVSAGMESSL